jgi:hypothetical protein
MSNATEAAPLPAPGPILGEIRAFAFETLPPAIAAEGWMIANGDSLNQLRYRALFRLIGTRWGSDDPANSFKIPDLSGLFLRGWTGKPGYDPDAADRQQNHPNGASGYHVGSYQPDVFGRHKHGTGDIVGLAVDERSGRYFEHASGGSGNDGGGTSRGGNETRPRNVYVLYAFFAGKPDAV